MSSAVIDDVSIGLMAWQPDAGAPGRWVATLQVASAAPLPVRFVPELIFITAATNGSTTAIAPLAESSLPCTLQPGGHVTLSLAFQIPPGQTPISLTVGLEESNRSGAHVLFPLASGAASATGGDGAAGADAIGGDATGADATAPGMPAAPATPPGPATPAGGSCAD